MTTSRVTVKGQLTEDGQVKIDLPEGWQPGEITVELSLEKEWSDEELDELLRSEPQSGAEIAASPEIGSWKQLGIEDSVEYVEEMRRKRREQNQW